MRKWKGAGRVVLHQEEHSGFSAHPGSQTSRNAGLWRLTPATTSQTSPPPLPRQGHSSDSPAETPTRLPPILGKARPDVLSHGAVPRNDAGPGGPAPRARAGRRQRPRAPGRCSRSCQPAQDAFNNMWGVISHNFLCICKPVSDP